MKKALKKIIASAAIFLFVFITGLVSIVFSPQILFADNLDYKKFTVYSSETFDEVNLKIRLDHAYKLIEQSELHDPNYHFDILLAHNHFFNNIESLQGGEVIARATAGYITIKVPIDPANNHAKSVKNTTDLTYLIAHEMIHVLQANRYGLLNFSPIKHPPMWKLEGYPEFIARRDEMENEDYDLKSEIDRYIRLERESTDIWIEVTENHFMPSYYYKGRLMVEYLIRIKGMTYDQILSDARSEEQIFDELIEWRNEE